MSKNINFKYTTYDKLGISLFIVSILLLIVTLVTALNNSIRADEVLTFEIIGKSYLNTIQQTAGDVHPPLYYLIIKPFIDLAQTLNLNVIIFGKILSILPIIILLIIIYTKVKKQYDWLTAGIFALAVTSMPMMMLYSTEIRMYSLALFFVTLTYIYVKDLFDNPNKNNWIKVIIFGQLAAYTHYFAALAVGVIYVSILFYFYKEKNKIQLKQWLIVVLINIICYMPWLIVLINQLLKVNSGYWIEPITINSIINYVYFIFSPYSLYLPSVDFFGTFMLLAYFITIMCNLKLKKDNETAYALTGFLVLVITIFIGIVVSLISQPVFMERYILPMLGCFWLCFSILLAQIKNNKKIFSSILLIFLIISTIGTLNFITQQEMNTETMQNLEKQNMDIKSEDIIIHLYSQTYEIFKFYNPNNTQYLYDGDVLNDSNKIKNFKKQNKTVWVFCLEQEQYILNNWSNENLTFKSYGNYPFEYYNLTIYHVQ